MTDIRAQLNELTDHLTDMADSLDDHVTHEDVHRLLMEARQLSLQRDAALTAVLDLHRRVEEADDPWSDEKREVCAGCVQSDSFGNAMAEDYPCPTVTTITDTLGGEAL